MNALPIESTKAGSRRPKKHSKATKRRKVTVSLTAAELNDLTFDELLKVLGLPRRYARDGDEDHEETTTVLDRAVIAGRAEDR